MSLRSPAGESFYVLDRHSGNEILVTADIQYEFRDSCRYIRLDKPAPASTPDVIEKAKEKGTARQAKKADTAKPKKKKAVKET